MGHPFFIAHLNNVKKSGIYSDVLVKENPAHLVLFSLNLHTSGRVAQLDRVLASEAKGRGFESRLAHQ